MTGDQQKKIREINARLKAIMLRHMKKPGIRASAINGLTLVRRESADSADRCFEKPLASVIIQGGKHSIVGSQKYHVRANQCLVTGKAQHVDVQCLHIYRLSPGCLSSIHDQKQAVPVCKL